MRKSFLFIFLFFIFAFPLLSHGANNTNDIPWALDSTGTITTRTVTFTCIRWVGGTTAGHQAILSDGNGRVIWSDVAAASNFVSHDCATYTFTGGLTVTTLGSGIIYLYDR